MPDSCLVAESDRMEGGEYGELGAKIMKKRFEQYNQLWLLETESHRDSYDDDYGTIINNSIRRSSTFRENMSDILGDTDDDGSEFSPYGRRK